MAASLKKALMVKLITTIKNRLDHFLKTFPFMTSQYGCDYDLIIVDFFSKDELEDTVAKEIAFKKDSFSNYLNSIKYVKLLKDLKFSTKKAKNLGASHCNQNDILAFSDVDVLLSMDYLAYWSLKINKGKSFVATRQKDTMAAPPKRIRPEINYGNFLIYADDYFKASGFDESILNWGGADDDFFHRLKLCGLNEINPNDPIEAKQYSILHGDDLRLSLLEDTNRYDKEILFEKIFSNKDRRQSKESNFLDTAYARKASKETIIYER